MSLNIRRVVTGHDDQGRAKVMIDETVGNVISQRPGALYSVIWSSEGFPVDNDTELDPSGKKIEHIDVPEAWSANVCFGGKDRQTLFITASNGLYAMRMSVKGVDSQ
jgi:sugar lactone lactonase YvrE